MFSFLALLLSASFAIAQVQSGQSRLNIGKNPTPSTITTKPVSSYVVRGTVPSEVSVNSHAVINAFYRDLLVNNSSKKVVAAKSTYKLEVVHENKLYVDKDLSVSNIYPNPAHEFAILDYSLKDSRKNAKVSFSNILGGSVGEYHLDSFDNSLRINTENWDNGIYFYQLILEGKKVATKKLLVRHN
jgi:hypothetical protein